MVTISDGRMSTPQARGQAAAGLHLQVPLPQPLLCAACSGPGMHLPAHAVCRVKDMGSRVLHMHYCCAPQTPIHTRAHAHDTHRQNIQTIRQSDNQSMEWTTSILRTPAE